MVRVFTQHREKRRNFKFMLFERENQESENKPNFPRPILDHRLNVQFGSDETSLHYMKSISHIILRAQQDDSLSHTVSNIDRS